MCSQPSAVAKRPGHSATPIPTATSTESCMTYRACYWRPVTSSLILTSHSSFGHLERHPNPGRVTDCREYFRGFTQSVQAFSFRAIVHRLLIIRRCTPLVFLADSFINASTNSKIFFQIFFFFSVEHYIFCGSSANAD